MDYEAPITKNHYSRMNAYRNSAEYAEYASAIGFGSLVPAGELPSLLGNRWEINKEIFDEFLNMLPPLQWRRYTGGESFFMCELTFDNIGTKFTREGNKYYCEHARAEREVRRA
jgi:hypothetical protein